MPVSWFLEYFANIIILFFNCAVLVCCSWVFLCWTVGLHLYIYILFTEMSLVDSSINVWCKNLRQGSMQKMTN